MIAFGSDSSLPFDALEFLLIGLPGFTDHTLINNFELCHQKNDYGGWELSAT